MTPCRCNSIVSFLLDEQGGELVEQTMVAGIVVVAAITLVGAEGAPVLARSGPLNLPM